MDLQSAFEELGIAEWDGLTRERVRRLYMRRLREHPPERDPDGFRRLREAFEMVCKLVAAEDAAEVAAAPQAPAIVIIEAPAPASPPASAPHVEPAPVEPPPVEAAAEGSSAPPVEERPPLPAIAAGLEPSLSLAGLMTAVLQLLEDGEVEAAIELHRAWRARADADDYRQSSQTVAARWVLVRELLAAAADLPFAVLRALVRGLMAGDLSTSRPALDAYWRSQNRAAGEAYVLLHRVAPSIFSQVGDALWQPSAPRPRADSGPPRRSDRAPSRESGAPWITAIVAVLLIGVVMCLPSARTTTSYYEPPVRPELWTPASPAPVSLEAIFTPPPDPEPLRDLPNGVLAAEAVQSIQILRDNPITSEAQRVAATDLGRALDDRPRRCARVRQALGELGRAPPLDESDSWQWQARQDAARAHIAAIRERIDRICPARPARRRAAEKRDP